MLDMIFTKTFITEKEIAPYSIWISRMSDNKCLIQYYRNNAIEQSQKLTLAEMRSLLKNYNEPSMANRAAFDNVVIKDNPQYTELSRVIGITNYLAHYFIDLSSLAEAENFIMENIDKYLKGFTFVDWTRVKKTPEDDETDTEDQLLYILSDKVMEEYKDIIDTLQAAGHIGLICLKSDTQERKENKELYFITSSELNKNKNTYPLYHKIISEINAQLSRNFR